MATRPVAAPLRQLPNVLTLLRFAAIPVFVVLYVDAGDGPAWAAGIVFAAAAATDQLDGWLARRWHVESAFGKVADPLADRLMIGVAVVLLWADGRLPWPGAVIVLGRDLLLLVGYKLVVPRGYDFNVSFLGKLATWVLVLRAHLRDRDREGHRLAAGAVLDRRGARGRRGRAVPAQGAPRSGEGLARAGRTCPEVSS